MTHRPQPLAGSQLTQARVWARAQVPDARIVGALRAQVRSSDDLTETERHAALVLLSDLHADTVADLDDQRDYGLMAIQVLSYAAALGQRLDPDAFVPATEDTAAPLEVSATMASMCQFLARQYLLDPDLAKEEGAKVARQVAQMSTSELKQGLVRMAGDLGLRLVPMEDVA